MISFLAAPSRVAIVFGTMMTAVTLSTVIAAPGDSNIIVVRDLSGRVGPIIGSALACDNIARPRVRDIADKFQAVIQHASPVDAERDSLTRILDRYVADGRNAVASGNSAARQRNGSSRSSNNRSPASGPNRRRAPRHRLMMHRALAPLRHRPLLPQRPPRHLLPRRRPAPCTGSPIAKFDSVW